MKSDVEILFETVKVNSKILKIEHGENDYTSAIVAKAMDEFLQSIADKEKPKIIEVIIKYKENECIKQ